MKISYLDLSLSLNIKWYKLNLLTKRNKLIKTSESDLSRNFIAIAMKLTKIDSGVQIGDHSALLICVHSQLYIFHYLPSGIIFRLAIAETDLGNYYHKEIKFFSTSDSFLDAVLARFESIKKRSKIMYSMIFDSSHYDENGLYVSKSGLPEFATCVGFCINVLSGLILESDEFVKISDWDNFDIKHPKLQEYIEAAKEAYPDLDESKYQTHHKRITPNECTITGYFSGSDIPISKARVQELQIDFEIMVQRLFIP